MAMPRGSAFRCAGGNVPQAVPDADAWQLIHLYAAAPAFDNGAAFDGTAQPKHYMTIAGLCFKSERGDRASADPLV